jgi:hypothetical protein
LRKEERKLWQPILPIEIASRDLSIAISIKNFKPMPQVDCFIAFVEDLKHADSLNTQRNSWQDELSSVEIERRVLSFSFQTNF